MKKEFFSRFCWALPLSFSVPLSNCRFEEGDLLYDTKQAYDGKWRDALVHISNSIQILTPSRGSAAALSGEADSDISFKRNWEMKVTFDLTDYKNSTKKKVRTTQGRLYCCLWKGRLEYIEGDELEAQIPILSSELKPWLSEMRGIIRRKMIGNFECAHIFAMPFDCTNPASRRKYNLVKTSLKKIEAQSCQLIPDSSLVNIGGEIAPTASIACFAVPEEDKSKIEAELKKSLYKPSRNKSTDKDRFHVSNHGHLFHIEET